ncbi:MAG: molybdenum cofactor biosynthesis protein MoaE [Ponticaulis sp.]|nr:molybdenum cofactor biosynthesis protein MoaE [Ponticaulis sp.]
MTIEVIVSKDPFDAGLLLSEFTKTADQAGGIVSFSGQVRPKANQEDVSALVLQSYEPMTTEGIRARAVDAQKRWPLDQILIRHRIGLISTGETIVFVATASAHRRAAFEAADFLMDYLKTEAVFWKKEVTESGEHWIEPRKEDYQDGERWNVD